MANTENTQKSLLKPEKVSIPSFVKVTHASKTSITRVFYEDSYYISIDIIRDIFPEIYRASQFDKLELDNEYNISDVRSLNVRGETLLLEIELLKVVILGSNIRTGTLKRTIDNFVKEMEEKSIHLDIEENSLDKYARRSEEMARRGKELYEAYRYSACTVDAKFTYGPDDVIQVSFRNGWYRGFSYNILGGCMRVSENIEKPPGMVANQI